MESVLQTVRDFFSLNKKNIGEIQAETLDFIHSNNIKLLQKNLRKYPDVTLGLLEAELKRRMISQDFQYGVLPYLEILLFSKEERALWLLLQYSNLAPHPSFLMFVSHYDKVLKKIYTQTDHRNRSQSIWFSLFLPKVLFQKKVMPHLHNFAPTLREMEEVLELLHQYCTENKIIWVDVCRNFIAAWRTFALNECKNSGIENHKHYSFFQSLVMKERKCGVTCNTKAFNDWHRKNGVYVYHTEYLNLTKK